MSDAYILLDGPGYLRPPARFVLVVEHRNDLQSEVTWTSTVTGRGGTTSHPAACLNVFPIPVRGGMVR